MSSPPLVRFQQGLDADITAGGTAPKGYGHVYAPEHYLDACVEVTDPQSWTEAGLARLREKFADR